MFERLNNWQVFRAPLAILLLSLVGLIWALLAEGLADVVASAMAGAPLLAVMWTRWRRRRRYEGS